ncbi:hypothetical protein ACRAWF_32635 [Streptomyces sp. L7]
MTQYAADRQAKGFQRGPAHAGVQPDMDARGPRATALPTRASTSASRTCPPGTSTS